VLVFVWIGVAVLALVVLGAMAHGVFGAFARLGREMAALDREVRPVLEEIQAAQAAAAERSARPSD
jgi:hypothetical protein